MLAGEMRYQPAIASMPQVPSEARFSRVELLSSEISIDLRLRSSVGRAREGDRRPGATVSGCGGRRRHHRRRGLIDTVGATPSSLTIQVRSRGVEVGLARRCRRPRAWAARCPRSGTVISFDHVVLLAPTTSGSMRKVLYEDVDGAVGLEVAVVARRGR